ncbi:MAG TPA: PAS domain-containing protein [Ferrovibrio sp.]|jgi:hypothetical protein|uniref:PAS domain-containing protein n=1 Tax=Ferrovibrio sp. TaxID=1917215 RepID=UPI002ED02791
MDLLDRLPSPLTANSRRFFTIWDRWRRGRKLPERRDISAAALGDLADYCLLLDIRGRDEIRIAMVGRMITERLGFDLAGMNYLDLTSRENRAWRAHLTVAQAAQPCGVVIYYWLRFADGSVLPVEFSGAPLCENGAEAATLILCCATGLTKTMTDSSVLDPDSYEEGDGMRFIDLGYGVPPLVPSQRQEPRPVQ